jgi:phytoene dehydrogenase-like protein
VERIAGDRVPSRVRRAWSRFRRGSGTFKLDYALDGPMPWTSSDARRSGTVHLGGTWQEVAAAEAEVRAGRVAERPYVLVAQQSIFDDTRAPAGKQTLWAYCHVPNGCAVDVSDTIEAQFDRFAPGWRDLVLARAVTTPADLESYNPNYIGGAIDGGASELHRVLFRPDWSVDPYRVGDTDLWLCSSSTPPGAGVHGICGRNAARSVLRAIG